MPIDQAFLILNMLALYRLQRENDGKLYLDLALRRLEAQFNAEQMLSDFVKVHLPRDAANGVTAR